MVSTDRHGEIKRILVIQLARFGDFLQTTPLLAALKEQHPEAKLTVLVDRPQASPAQADPRVDEVLTVDLSHLKRLAQNRRRSFSATIKSMKDSLGFWSGRPFDWVINLNTSNLAALIAELAPAARRDGPQLSPDRTNLIPAPWAAFIMNLMRCRALIRFNLVDLLLGYAQVDHRPTDRLTYSISPAARRQAERLVSPESTARLIGFQLASRHESRQWPPDCFALLARDLIEKDGARIVLLGTESERPIGGRFMDRLAECGRDLQRHVIDLMGQTSLEDLGGVLARLDLLVTPDTGTMHLAAAAQTPILALFIGPAWCHETGPYGSGHVILQVVAPCAPCMESGSSCNGFPCRRYIDPALVFQTAMWQLTRGRQPLPTPEELGPNLRLFRSEFDDFGVVCRPLAVGSSDRRDWMALAYREAGRRFMRPACRKVNIAPPHLEDFLGPPTEHARLALERTIDVLAKILLRFNGGPPSPPLWRQAAEAEDDLTPLAFTAMDLIRHGDPGAAKSLVADMVDLLSAAVRPR